MLKDKFKKEKVMFAMCEIYTYQKLKICNTIRVPYCPIALVHEFVTFDLNCTFIFLLAFGPFRTTKTLNDMK